MRSPLLRRLPLWRHEARRAGWVAALAAPAALVAGTAMAVLAAGNGASRSDVGRLLLSSLEALLPLALGMAAVTVVARDGCRELQLTLPTRYAGTLGRRLGVLVGFGALLALLYSAGLWLADWWTGPDPLAAPLVWAPPTLWLTALAVLLGLLGRSVVVATTGIAAVWLGEQLFAATLAGTPWARPFFLFATTRVGVGDGWWTNRLALSVTGAIFVVAVVVLLRRPQLLLTEEEV